MHIFRKFEPRFAIVVIYFNDMNLVETPVEILKSIEYLKREFEMKDLG